MATTAADAEATVADVAQRVLCTQQRHHVLLAAADLLPTYSVSAAELLTPTLQPAAAAVGSAAAQAVVDCVADASNGEEIESCEMAYDDAYTEVVGKQTDFRP